MFGYKRNSMVVITCMTSIQCAKRVFYFLDLYFVFYSLAIAIVQKKTTTTIQWKNTQSVKCTNVVPNRVLCGCDGALVTHVSTRIYVIHKKYRVFDRFNVLFLKIYSRVLNLYLLNVFSICSIIISGVFTGQRGSSTPGLGPVNTSLIIIIQILVALQVQ